MPEFAVKQASFEGPLSLLIELLHKKELEITAINLASIAEDYLAYVESQQIDPQEMADFLLVAARLIYLKSRELLPVGALDPELDELSLEDQLRAYQVFLDASKGVGALFASQRASFSRKQPKLERAQDFDPSANLTAANVATAFAGLLKRLQPFFQLSEAQIEKIKSVEERLAELKDLLQSKKQIAFKQVIAGAKNRAEVVVSFLAVLELVRRQVILAKQVDHVIMLESYES